MTTPPPAIDPAEHIRTVVQRLTIGQARRWLFLPALWAVLAVAATLIPALGLALDARPVPIGLFVAGTVLTQLLLILSLREADLAGWLVGAPLAPRWCRWLAFWAYVPVPHLPCALALYCLLDNGHGHGGIIIFAVMSAVYHAWRWGYLAIPGEWVLVVAALVVAVLESAGVPMRLTGTLVLAGASVVHLLIADQHARRMTRFDLVPA